METILYLIEHHTGEYDTSFSKVIKAYFSKQKRDIEIERLNKLNEEMESLRDFWNLISDKLDDIEKPEYDEFWDNYTDGDIPPKFENYLYSDSFERFVYWMTEYLPEEFSKYEEEYWEKIFNYYITLNGQYGSSEPGYYYPCQCKLYD